MNKTHAVAHVGVPFAVVVGGSLATLAIIGPGHYRPTAAAPPRATVTVTQAPATAPAVVRTVTPSPTASGPTPAATVQSVSARRAALPHTGSGGLSHSQARPPSTPSPSSAAPCGGRVLSVRALHDRACLSIGR